VLRVALALSVSFALAGAAVGCWVKTRELTAASEWFYVRGNAQAQEYVDSFDGSYIEQELQTFEQHRDVLNRAHRWQAMQEGFVIASAVAGLSAYAAFLAMRLRQQRVDAGDLPAEAELEAMRSARA
jgi:hypothetical protein